MDGQSRILSGIIQISDFDPFTLKRSAGIGVRVFLPMFGLLGLDYGYRFDDIKGYPGMQKGIFHFIIGQNFNWFV